MPHTAQQLAYRLSILFSVLEKGDSGVTLLMFLEVILLLTFISISIFVSFHFTRVYTLLYLTLERETNVLERFISKTLMNVGQHLYLT